MIVLIVAKCNVNSVILKSNGLFLIVLIVAKCNVNGLYSCKGISEM